jgi:hypothetical protein
MPKSSRLRRARRAAAQPIDAEVEVLADAGLLHEKLDLSRAYELARKAVDQAALWARWYEERQQARQSAKSAHKDRADDCRRLGEQLASFVGQYAQRPPAGLASLSSSFLTHVNALFDELDWRATTPPPASGKSGHPSDPWLLGFIWGMSVGWRQLTPANIGTVGRFPRFVQAGLDMAAPDRVSAALQTLIKTAIARFRMRERAWLQPVARGGKK